MRAADATRSGGSTSPPSAAARYLGILSAGLDSDANRIANDNTLPLGTAVYAYAALRALAKWKTARWTVAVDGETREFDGYCVAVSNSGVYGSGMYLVPDAELDDGLLDVVLVEDVPKRRYLASLPEGLQGHPPRRARDPPPARAQRLLPRRPAVHRPTRTATRSPSCPATVDVVPGTLRVLAP